MPVVRSCKSLNLLVIVVTLDEEILPKSTTKCCFMFLQRQPIDDACIRSSELMPLFHENPKPLKICAKLSLDNVSGLMKINVGSSLITEVYL